MFRQTHGYSLDNRCNHSNNPSMITLVLVDLNEPPYKVIVNIQTSEAARLGN